MDLLHSTVAFACITIILVCIWACLSVTVRDRMPLKLSLAITSVSAYLVMTHQNERTFSMLAISIAAVCITAGYQRFVQRSRLFHRSTDGVTSA